VTDNSAQKFRVFNILSSFSLQSIMACELMVTLNESHSSKKSETFLDVLKLKMPLKEQIIGLNLF